jgi:2-polyprenyl-3-methyl-5-hydroxy-6-metoxy-1,4-benzoquinol methylase
MATAGRQPSPELLFETINGFQRTAAIKGAIELDVFTAIAEGANTAAALAKARKASERGMRILCDYLTVIGFLTKSDGRYSLTTDSATFLDKRSPAYLGTMVKFLTLPEGMIDQYKDIAATVRKGGTISSEDGTIAPENPIWVEFARSMMPMMVPAAQAIAGILEKELSASGNKRVLDVAAGHGIFGITLAQRFANVEATALDWKSVLEVAKDNANQRGVSNRFKILPGSAFEVDPGKNFDAVLLTNFLHHFDIPTCEKLLRKFHAALKPGGTVVILEFVPNEDRVTPAMPAAFALIMLASTPSGDAYTRTEYEAMLRNSGFSSAQFHSTPGPEMVITAKA